MDDMADLVAEGRGKEYFDSFRATMTALQAAGAEAMATRRAANEDLGAQTRTMIPAAIGGAILIGGLLALVIASGIASGIRRIVVSMRRPIRALKLANLARLSADQSVVRMVKRASGLCRATEDKSTNTPGT